MLTILRILLSKVRALCTRQGERHHQVLIFSPRRRILIFFAHHFGLQFLVGHDCYSRYPMGVKVRLVNILLLLTRGTYCHFYWWRSQRDWSLFYFICVFVQNLDLNQITSLNLESGEFCIFEVWRILKVLDWNMKPRQLLRHCFWNV